METQKIVNLLNNFENEYSRFAKKNEMLLIVSQKVIIYTINPIKYLTNSVE